MLTGNSFLRGYYSIHDMHDGYIGMAPHSNSRKRWIEVGTVPQQVLQAASMTEEISGLILALVIGGWIYLMEYMRSELDWEPGWITFVQILGTVVIGCLMIFFVIPALNGTLGNS